MWRRRIHRVRLWAQALFAIFVIGLALLAGIYRLALPWMSSHPERIGEFLSARLHREVTVERVEGTLERNGPLLVLSGVHIAAATKDKPPSVIPQAELKINFFPWVHRNQTWTEFRLIGLNLELTRDIAGNWQMHGLDAVGGENQGGDSNGNALFNLGSLIVRDLHLNIDDAMSGRKLAFAADEVRLINNGDKHRILARVRCLQTQSPPLDVVVDYDSEDRSGEIYLGGRQLDLGAILQEYPLAGLTLDRGKGNAQLWTWWRSGRLIQARAEIDLTNMVMTTPSMIVIDDKREIAPTVAFDHIAFGARWQRTDNGWRADVADLVLARQGEVPPAADIHVEKYRVSSDTAPSYSLSANAVDLSAPASVAMLSDSLPPWMRRWLYQADPVGKINVASLRFADLQDFDLSATMSGISWHAVDKFPGVSDLTATVRGDHDAFSISLPARSAFGIDAARVFRQPLEFSEFSGIVAAYRIDNATQTDGVEPASAQPTQGSGWRIEADSLDFEGAGYGGQLTGAIELHDDGSKPFLDIYAALTHAEVSASHLFWPINSMSPAGVTYLDRALDAGRVLSARAVFRGDLTDWPFRNNAGRFEARADVDDVRFVYLPDWPAAEHVRGVADFVGLDLHVDVSALQAMGLKATSATVDIPDLSEVVVDLAMAGGGNNKDLLAFLKASPLGQRFGAQLLGVDITGQGKVDFRLHQPVKMRDQLELDGSVILSDADLTDAKYNLHLNKANGKIRFTQRGFTTDDLPVTMNGAPANFNLAVGGFTSDAHHAVEATLRATLPARDVLAYAPPLQAWSDRISGSALWNAGFSSDADSVGTATGQRITLKSDLRGVTLDLPAPLKKSADVGLPLSVTLGIPIAGGSLDLHIADWLHMRGRLASLTQPFAARVDLGAPQQAPLPIAGFAIDGDIAQLDLSGWLDVTTSDSGGGTGLVSDIDVHAENLSAYARDFGSANFKLTPGADGLEIAFTGANIDGTLHVPVSELRKRGVTAQFNRLYWPEAAEAQSTALAGENPAAVPPLHVHISDFRLGEGKLGDAILESYPLPDGMHFEQVSAHSDNLEMRAHGDWTGRPGSDISHFVIDFTAQNLGHMLDTFGYAGVVDGGKTVAQIDGTWEGSPSTIALARIDGSLKVSVAEGRIPEANPGAGRIFGLFNLSAIPRRLTLDFGDLFKSGFSFDSITGLFTLKNGNAVTSDLQVKGPTADINVTGRTGLKSKDYDQIMEVTPHVGGTLAIGGALVGGPVGAAAGAVLQGIFKNQINQATRIRYSVTGSWEKPTITELAKDNSKQPATHTKQGGKTSANSLRGLGL